MTAADLIEQALAAKQVPSRGADAHAFYRAQAVGFVTRKPGDMRNEVWANWVCQAIAACPLDDYPIAVHESLKQSRIAGQFIPPETNDKPQRKGAQRRGASQERDQVPQSADGKPKPFSVRDIKL